MLKKPLALMVTALVLAGCITEGDEPPVVRDDSDRKSRLERTHDLIAGMIDRMRFQFGKELLASVQQLVAYEELALEPVLAALPKTDARTRANLIFVLGFMDQKSARQAIASSLEDEDAVVRYEAAAGLMGHGDWSAVPVLISFMDSEDRHLRYKSFQVLQKATGQKFDYDFNHSATEREIAIGRWKSWWQNRRRELIYGKR